MAKDERRTTYAQPLEDRAESSPRSAKTQPLRALLPLLIAAGLLLLLLVGSDPSETMAELDSASPSRLLAVVALNLPMAGLLAFRSNLVLKRLGYRLRAEVLLPLAILGNVAGSFTPAASGEALRATALRRHGALPLSEAVTIIVYERGLSVYLLGLSTALMGAIAFLPPEAAVAGVAGVLPLLALPIAGAGLLRLLPAPSAQTEGSMLRRLAGRISSASDLLQELLRDHRLAAKWYAVTAAIFGLVSIQLWLLAGMGNRSELTPVEAWFAFGGSQLIGIASLLPLGLGAVDGSLAAILHQGGLDVPESAAVAILVRATTTVPLGLAAVGSYLLLQKKPTSPAAIPSGESENSQA